MRSERRTDRRHALHYTVYIDAGDASSPRPCLLLEASNRGARLAINDTTALPDRFRLLLVRNGTSYRECRVAWRSSTQVGVAYLKPLAGAGKKPAATEVVEIDA